MDATPLGPRFWLALAGGALALGGLCLATWPGPRNLFCLAMLLYESGKQARAARSFRSACQRLTHLDDRAAVAEALERFDPSASEKARLCSGAGKGCWTLYSLRPGDPLALECHVRFDESGRVAEVLVRDRWSRPGPPRGFHRTF